MGQNITIGDPNIAWVKSFLYLGSQFARDGNKRVEIHRKISQMNHTYFVLLRRRDWKKCMQAMKQAWAMIQISKSTDFFERQVFWKTFGPTMQKEPRGEYDIVRNHMIGLMSRALCLQSSSGHSSQLDTLKKGRNKSTPGLKVTTDVVSYKNFGRGQLVCIVQTFL